METVLGSEHVEAIRLFHLDRNKLLLTSLNDTTIVWLPGEIQRAVCRHVPEVHGVELKPEADCTCGIWSCNSRAGLIKSFPALVMNINRDISFGGILPTLYRNPLVSARVEQWGVVIEHEWGYRSEYARIIPETIQFWPRVNIPQSKKLIKHLREKYATVKTTA